jgi:predicted metal-dependent phosphotriesterase family hydrolase
MNAAAVEHMTQILGGAGRFVWMSTYDAENQVRFSKENRPFVGLSKDGVLLQTTKDVIAVIAKHGLVLATGHVSAAEGLMLVREARRQGVQHIVITHAMNPPIEMTIPQMQEAAREGAFIEFAGQSLRSRDAAERVQRFADAIRAVGPASCILSSDLGQKTTPLPTDGFAQFLSALSAKGFTDGELDRMAKVNPATLLGLQ